MTSWTRHHGYHPEERDVEINNLYIDDNRAGTNFGDGGSVQDT